MSSNKLHLMHVSFLPVLPTFLMCKAVQIVQNYGMTVMQLHDCKLWEDCDVNNCSGSNVVSSNIFCHMIIHHRHRHHHCDHRHHHS